MGLVRSVLIGVTRCGDKREITFLPEIQGQCGSERKCSPGTIKHDTNAQVNDVTPATLRVTFARWNLWKCWQVQWLDDQTTGMPAVNSCDSSSTCFVKTQALKSGCHNYCGVGSEPGGTSGGSRAKFVPDNSWACRDKVDLEGDTFQVFLPALRTTSDPWLQESSLFLLSSYTVSTGLHRRKEAPVLVRPQNLIIISFLREAVPPWFCFPDLADLHLSSSSICSSLDSGSLQSHLSLKFFNHTATHDLLRSLLTPGPSQQSPGLLCHHPGL